MVSFVCRMIVARVVSWVSVFLLSRLAVLLWDLMVCHCLENERQSCLLSLSIIIKFCGCPSRPRRFVSEPDNRARGAGLLAEDVSKTENFPFVPSHFSWL